MIKKIKKYNDHPKCLQSVDFDIPEKPAIVKIPT